MAEKLDTLKVMIKMKIFKLPTGVVHQNKGEMSWDKENEKWVMKEENILQENIFNSVWNLRNKILKQDGNSHMYHLR